MSRLGSPIVGQTSSVAPLRFFATAFPDMHRELYSFYDVGDTVVVELALQGTTRAAGIASGNCAANRKADGRTVL